jgi:hypothetical protein
MRRREFMARHCGPIAEHGPTAQDARGPMGPFPRAGYLINLLAPVR